MGSIGIRSVRCLDPAETIGEVRRRSQAFQLYTVHRALVRCKYRWLYASGKRGRPGPKGPPKEVNAAVVEMKQRNPRFGCRKIAEQIAQTFGIEIDKDVVRRILAKHYHPASDGAACPG